VTTSVLALLLIAVLGLTCVGVVLAFRPRLAVPLAVFLLYTNLPVAAAQVGRAPRAAAVVVPLLLGVAFVYQVLVRRRPMILDRTFLLVLAFLGVMLLSAFGAKGYDVAFARIGGFFGEGVVIYFLVRNTVRDVRGLRAVMWAVVAAASLLGALTTFQAVTHTYTQSYVGLAQTGVDPEDALRHPNHRDPTGVSKRARGPMDEPNRFAQVLLMALPLALVLALGPSRRWTTALVGLLSAAVLGGMVLTYSRGAFLGFVVLLVLAMFLGLAQPRKVLALMLAGALLLPVLLPTYVARIASLSGLAGLVGSEQVQADPSERGRTTEMLAALAAYLDHPILGVGPGQYFWFYSVHYMSLPGIGVRELTVPRRAHDLYLEIAAETGTLGLLVFVSVPLLILRDLERVRRACSRRRPELARLAAGFMLTLLAYLGTGVFLHLAYERYYWFMIALSASAVGVLQGTEARSSMTAPEAEVEAACSAS
jgi:O-Antigen ligase